VRLDLDRAAGPSSIRISFTDQRLTAHGGMIVWSHFLHQKKFRQELAQVLPHAPTSPNAYAPTDIALGYLGGILAGADKLSRVAWLQSDPAIAEVLGVEAIASQSTLSRFFGEFSFQSCEALAGLHAWALRGLPSSARPREGYTLDLDSWALLHEDGHQEGVAVGFTRKGLKPCHRPLIAALAEPKMIAGYALRSGNTACVNGAAEFLRATVRRLPAQVRVGLVRGDSGFGDASVQEAAESLGCKFIFVARLTQPVQKLCRHDDAHWQPTEVPGIEVQEVEHERPGRRLILIRQRIAERPQAGGKTLLEVPGYRFQALVTNLARSTEALGVWRRYNGRADIENRIKELGAQFGIKALCCQSFWATEALHHLAIAAYNLCVLLQRRLGQLERCELGTLRWRLFGRAAIWSRARGKPTLRLAVQGEEARSWWRQILEKLTAPPNCHAVESFAA
jgi:Transposase DDE domain group 1